VNNNQTNLVIRCSFIYSLVCLSVIMQAQDVNLFDYAKGARVVDFSSNYGGAWDAQCILENAPQIPEGQMGVWCSESGAAFPHHLTVDLQEEKWMNIFVFNNFIEDETGWPGISAKDIEVHVSTQSKTSGFQKVVGFRLESNKNDQLVKIEPIKARWVKFVINSNYGHSEYTEFGQLGVYDDQKRAKDFKTEISSKGFIDVYGIYFDFASATLRLESAPAIQQITEYLKENVQQKILIEGHTDNVGSESANLSLSEKRANAVKEELVKNGIDAGRISIQGMGSKNPIADNSTDLGRAQNRRVTVRLQSQ